MYLFNFPEGLTGGSKETSYSTSYNTSHITTWTTSYGTGKTTTYGTSRTTSRGTAVPTSWGTGVSTGYTTTFNTTFATFQNTLKPTTYSTDYSIVYQTTRNTDYTTSGPITTSWTTSKATAKVKRYGRRAFMTAASSSSELSSCDVEQAGNCEIFKIPGDLTLYIVYSVYLTPISNVYYDYNGTAFCIDVDNVSRYVMTNSNCFKIPPVNGYSQYPKAYGGWVGTKDWTPELTWTIHGNTFRMNNSGYVSHTKPAYAKVPIQWTTYGGNTVIYPLKEDGFHSSGEDKLFWNQPPSLNGVNNGQVPAEEWWCPLIKVSHLSNRTHVPVNGYRTSSLSIAAEPEWEAGTTSFSTSQSTTGSWTTVYSTGFDTTRLSAANTTSDTLKPTSWGTTWPTSNPTSHVTTKTTTINTTKTTSFGTGFNTSHTTTKTTSHATSPTTTYSTSNTTSHITYG